MVFNIKYLRAFIVLAIGSVVLPGISSAAIVYTEDFNSGTAGWTSLDGFMTVSASGSQELQGDWGASPFPPIVDAFSITSANDTGGNFTGDLTGAGVTQISFDFKAVNVLPSDLFIRIIDGANTFFYQFNVPVAVNNWETFIVDLAWSYGAGWSGPSEAAFNTALTSVDRIDIQFTRGGQDAETYLVDNVTTYDTVLGDPGAPGVVPEPAVISMFISALFVLVAGRRRIQADGKNHESPVGAI